MSHPMDTADLTVDWNSGLLERYPTKVFSAELFLFAVGKCLAAVFACLPHCVLIGATIAEKNLHGVCNVLIAVNSAAMVFFNFYALPPLVLAATGINFVRLSTCFYLQTMPRFLQDAQNVILLLIAFDRLLAVSVPFWRNYVEHGSPRAKYLATLLSVPVFFGLGNLAVNFNHCILSVDYSQRLVFCVANDIAPRATYLVITAINLVSMSLYLAVWLLLKASSKTTSVYTRRLFNSLAAIALIEFFGWNMAMMLKNLLHSMGVSYGRAHMPLNCAAIFRFFVQGAYPIALYFLSGDYQRAFKRVFNLLHSLWATGESATAAGAAQCLVDGDGGTISNPPHPLTTDNNCYEVLRAPSMEDDPVEPPNQSGAESKCKNGDCEGKITVDNGRPEEERPAADEEQQANDHDDEVEDHKQQQQHHHHHHHLYSSSGSFSSQRDVFL